MKQGQLSWWKEKHGTMGSEWLTNKADSRRHNSIIFKFTHQSGYIYLGICLIKYIYKFLICTLSKRFKFPKKNLFGRTQHEKMSGFIRRATIEKE